jgi:hypothetical protein
MLPFSPSRCGTSVRLQPSIKRLAGTFKSQIDFARINVYAYPTVAQHYQLRAYPVFGVFTGRGNHTFWLTRKISSNSLFNLITRVAKEPDWVSRIALIASHPPSLKPSAGAFVVLSASHSGL